eukprot:648950-Prorocentrum_minimum.AAC.1
MRGLLPPTPLGTPPGGRLAALGSSDRLARPGNVKEMRRWQVWWSRRIRESVLGKSLIRLLSSYTQVQKSPYRDTPHVPLGKGDDKRILILEISSISYTALGLMNARAEDKRR